jgi:hypothetical protein
MRSFLVSRYWPEVALSSRSYFEWQLGSDSVGRCDVVTAWDGHRLAGILGYVAKPIFWGSTAENVRGAWLIALMVAPEYRHGVGIALLRNVQRRFPVVASLDVRPEAQRILSFLGFTVLPPLARYVTVVDPSRLDPFLIQGKGSEAELPEASTDSMHPVSVRTWDPEEEAPAWDQYPSLAFGTVRSPTFLRWRYLEHPVYAYSVLACGPRARPATCVYRIERPFGLEANVGRLIEFFHPGDELGREDGRTLLRTLTSRFSSAGCAFADHFTSCGDYGETLRAVGWAREILSRQQLALRLQPIDLSPYPAYRFTAVAFSTTGHERAFHAGDSIYITRGDGDADRPNTIPVTEG